MAWIQLFCILIRVSLRVLSLVRLLTIALTHAIDVSDISTTLSTYADDNNPLVAGCNSADNAREVIGSLCHQFDARNLFLNVQNLPRKCVSFSTIVAVMPYI